MASFIATVFMRSNLFKYLALLTAWAIPLAVPTLFESIVDKIFVDPFASEFVPSLLTDVLLFCLFAYALWFFIDSKICKRYLSWTDVLLIVLLSSYFFLYKYRWFGFSHWAFTSSSLVPWIKYVDVVIILPALLIIYKIIPPYRSKQSLVDKEFLLLDDAHIELTDHDELNRKDFAEFVTKHIVNTKSDRSFAVGINAKWGDGKTSFQFLISSYLKRDDPASIIISFNPWKSSDEKKIIYDFFELFSDELKVYSFRLGTKIFKYGQKLLETNPSWWTSIFTVWLLNNRNQNAQFDEIDHLLKEVDRKIIVFIDDLDRLSTREIMEVVKLIRNSANFRNTFFIVGYDQSYLHEALRKHSEYGSENFLEKIFQIQFDLSQVDKVIIKDKLFSYLADSLPVFKDEIQAIIYPKTTASDAFISYFKGVPPSDDYLVKIITNLRDVKRFVNSFSLSMKQVGTEVIVGEYFLLSLIKFRFPKLIDAIKHDKPKYIEETIDPFQHQKLREEAFKKLVKACKIPKHERANIMEVFKKIYERPAVAPDSRSILLIDNFYVYYDNSLSGKGVLFGRILDLLDRPWSEARKNIRELIMAGKGHGLAGVLGDIDVFRSINRFKNSVYTWVSLANLDLGMELNLSLWVDEVNKKEGKLRAFESFNPDEFFKSLFLPSHNQEFFYSTYIIRLILRRYIDEEDFKFPTSKDELQRISVKRLTEYIESRKDFDKRVFDTFYYNCWEGKTKDNHVVLLSEANKVVRSYINKYPTDYLRFVIRSKYSPHIDNEYVFEPFIPQYFGDWDAFEKFLFEVAEKNKGFASMLSYFEQFKASGYKSFYSKEIPEWIDIDDNGNSTLKYFKDQNYEEFLIGIEKKYNKR